jgi:type II secretory pathway pseudopilin PulG
MLIVVTIIAILAVLVVPHLLSANRRARESTLKANINQLRGAISRFEGDVGMYPGVLQDLVAPTPADLSGAIPQGLRDSYRGPYLTDTGGIAIAGFLGLPLNPFIAGSDADATHHWTYNASTGAVICPASIGGTTLEGVVYTNL